jgi:ribosomal protein L25 (general stress protein Ctc)
MYQPYVHTYGIQYNKLVTKLLTFLKFNRKKEDYLPAIIHSNGTQLWYMNGQLHRNNDLPAVICSDGTRFWYINGKKHRDNDLPAVIYPYGYQHWSECTDQHKILFRMKF